MIIKRKGTAQTLSDIMAGHEIEIELTPKELYEAHVEQEHNYDVSNVKNYFLGWEDSDFVDAYGRSRNEVEESFDDIASGMREYLNDDYAYDEAIEMAIEKCL